jgi:glycosyltransferase involved in cell wall biosynthesis
MTKPKIIIQFICYSPRIYSAFDKYNLLLSRHLKQNGLQSVFVFSDKIDVQAIKDDLIKEGVIIELIDTKSKLTITRDVLHIFIKYKPAVVHVHFENFIQFLAAILSVIFRSKYFITFHSTISKLSITEYPKKKGISKLIILRLYYKTLIAVSQHVFCVSQAIKKQFHEYSASASKKIQCLYLGVQVNFDKKLRVDLRSFLSLPQDDILLCNISAIEPIKGIDVIIKAVYLLKNKYKISGFKFYHIGGLRNESEEGRAYEKEIRELVHELKIENEFIWMGHRNDINEILSSFDIYVHPSRMEGLGLALMEAGSHSFPLIGSNVGGIPEIVHHEENGFLFPLESSEILAEYLKELIENPSLRKIFGKASFDTVYENFNIENQTLKLLAHYLSVV